MTGQPGAMCRLTYRTLTEFAGSGSEGGRYDCPIGAITADNLGRRLIVQVKPGIRWAQGSETLTGLDVSGRLLAMTNPSDAAYRVDWADLLAAVSVRDLYRVEVDLRHAYVRPEAMLQTMLVRPRRVAFAGSIAAHERSVRGRRRDAGETVFVANGQYFAAEAGQPKELVQRTLSHLRQGDCRVPQGRNPRDRPRESLEHRHPARREGRGRRALRAAAGPLPDSQCDVGR